MGGFSSSHQDYTGYKGFMDQITSAIQNVGSNSPSIYSSNSVEEIYLDTKIDSVSADKQQSHYFAEEYSDKDKVDENIFNKLLTTDMKAKLSSIEYKILCEYLQGKTIRDVLDQDGHLIINDNEINSLIKKHETELKLTSDFNKSLNTIFSTISGEKTEVENPYGNTLKNIKEAAGSMSMGEYSDSILDTKIAEVVHNDSGYDAIVYEKDGEALIVNTGADGNTKDDILLILYSSLYSSMGSDELYAYLSPMLENSEMTINAGDLGNITASDILKAKELYDKQRAESYELIKKYAEKGPISLAGYSMGGGIMLDSYMQYVKDSPDKAKNVKIDLFNPYLGFIEGNSDYTVKGKSFIEGKQQSIKELVEKYGDNINIRSVEGDVVTQFNSVVDSFGDCVTYLPAKEGSPYKLEAFNGNILSLIVGGNSRHSYDSIATDTYDKDGNVVKTGTQITLNEIGGGTISSNTFSTMISDAFSDNIKYLEKMLTSYDFGENEYIKPGLEKIYEGLVEYVKNNQGNLNYDGLMEAITPGFTDILKAGAIKQGKEKYSFIGEWIAEKINDGIEEYTGDAIKEYIMSDDGQKIVKNLIGEMMNNNFENVDTILSDGKIEELATNIYMKTLEEHYPNRFRAANGDIFGAIWHKIFG